ncbi:YncE family protein [Pseudobacteriovorax antillogorgiicola]|uniref:Uncharacterized protein n=1 Tax=Pseudobacteriovorax antillogorgiicola TaxID=1513793 RepID=A0A1Y6CW71_9BACT|nr:hypothetical protein [Pseudobacteriovorax antillogorgiicola]TCS51623.1 hypothetical protein EDD56_1107 [Pseudobacteriovorax antillogorgiicola]SMF81496.1 hypothetical protein SAMN06296036_1377 [Pseudobacteriovorax antillogorgiicola]
MIAKILSIALFMGLMEQASATACRGKWTYEEWNSCRHEGNGIEFEEVIENGVVLKPVSRTYQRTYTSDRRLKTLVNSGNFNVRIRKAVDRCKSAFEKFTPEIVKKPNLSKQSWKVLTNTITISDYESLGASKVPGFSLASFYCKFKVEFFEEWYVAEDNPKKVSPAVYFNKPNPLCGRTKKETSLGFDSQTLEFENGQKVDYRSKFVCSTGDHLKDETPKELANKLEFLLSQLRRSKVGVTEVEKSLMADDISNYINTRESDIDQSLLDILFNYDLYSIDFEDSLENKSMISLSMKNNVGNMLLYNIMSDDILIDHNLPITVGVQDHVSKYGLNSKADTMYFLDEFNTSIAKMNLSNKTVERLIKLDSKGGYNAKGVFVSDDETRLVTHLVHSQNNNNFEEIALWDLESKTKIDSIFYFKGTLDEVSRQEHKTAFDRSTGQLFIGKDKKISVYDINMNAEISSIDLLQPVLNIYVARDGSKIGVVERSGDESTVEIIDTQMFAQVDTWTEKGVPVLVFGGPLSANEMGMEEDTAGDDGEASNSDLIIVGSSSLAQPYLPRGKIRVRDLSEQVFLDDVDINPGFGFITALDITEDGRYLLVGSYDRKDTSSPYVQHLRVLDLTGSDELDPGVVKDFVDSKLATNFFFMNRLDTMSQQAVEMARIAKKNASDEIPSQDGLISLKSLRVGIRTNQNMTVEMEGYLSKYGVEIEQTCRWARLPYIYQFADGVVYVTRDRKRFNVFDYDRVIASKCVVKNLPLATGGMLFNRDIKPVSLSNTVNPASGKKFAMPEYGIKVNQGIRDLIKESGEPVILKCRWASLPFVYRFNDSYMFVTSDKSKVNVFHKDTVDVRGCLGNNEFRFTK